MWIQPSREDIYLAFRQAKTAMFYERRGVGLLEFASWEDDLHENILRLEGRYGSPEFDPFSEPEAAPKLYAAPKRALGRGDEADSEIVNVGGPTASQGVEVQFRQVSTPELAIAEVFYLWRFGAALQSLVPLESLGYRLRVRRGDVSRTQRDIFEHWPTAYNNFRSRPLQTARRSLRWDQPVMILSADLASFYDSVDTGFLLQQETLEAVSGYDPNLSMEEYVEATQGLLAYHARYRSAVSAVAGSERIRGIPIGSLLSRLVANVSLSTLDKHVLQHGHVLSYHRYVDDIAIVARADSMENAADAEACMGQLFPTRVVEGAEEEVFLDETALDRPNCEFRVQRKKLRIHFLAGTDGEDLIRAIQADFGRIVSEKRAFLDHSVLQPGTAAQEILRVARDGSTLRVLRDADRIRLERFSLSNKLRSLERLCTLIGPDEARQYVRRLVDRVGRVVASRGNWVESLDASLRLLSLAIRAEDTDSIRELLSQLRESWGTRANLQSLCGNRVLFCGQEIVGPRIWTVLRDYLHERLIEAVCSVVSPTTRRRDVREWSSQGVQYRTRTLQADGLLQRARLLARADLRQLDREDDNFFVGRQEEPTAWKDDFGSSALASRFAIVQKYVDLCHQTGDTAWSWAPARLFLSTRPPAYFDVSRRLFRKVDFAGFPEKAFELLADLVNALRGTVLTATVGRRLDESTVEIPNDVSEARDASPKLLLGNLVLEDGWFKASLTRKPGARYGQAVLSAGRLAGLNLLLERAAASAGRAAADHLLVLPELGLPRQWLRPLASHVIEQGLPGFVAGLEYAHGDSLGTVYNQAVAVIPGEFRSVATWSWTKRLPARGEGEELAKVGLRFPEFPPDGPRRTVVHSRWGKISLLICSELLEARRVADLIGRVELVLVPAWNTDTSSYSHLVRSTGLQLGAVVAVANNGHYSDCRAWAPLGDRWRRELCRLVQRDVDSVVRASIPLNALREFQRTGENSRTERALRWKPLPPFWPSS
jgi:hypothetical protein